MSGEEMDPRATFKLDQEEAQKTEQTRDTTAWELNVRNGAANAYQTEAHAAHMFAKAAVWKAVSVLINWVTAFGVLAAVAWAVALLVGVFR